MCASPSSSSTQKAPKCNSIYFRLFSSLSPIRAAQCAVRAVMISGRSQTIGRFPCGEKSQQGGGELTDPAVGKAPSLREPTHTLQSISPCLLPLYFMDFTHLLSCLLFFFYRLYLSFAPPYPFSLILDMISPLPSLTVSHIGRIQHSL